MLGSVWRPGTALHTAAAKLLCFPAGRAAAAKYSSTGEWYRGPGSSKEILPSPLAAPRRVARGVSRGAGLQAGLGGLIIAVAPPAGSARGERG